MSLPWWIVLRPLVLILPSICPPVTWWAGLPKAGHAIQDLAHRAGLITYAWSPPGSPGRLGHLATWLTGLLSPSLFPISSWRGGAAGDVAANKGGAAT